MKKIMKKQSKKFLLWGIKGWLAVVLSGLGVTAHAQGAEVCYGSEYTIADAVSASTGSEYRWVENGNVLSGTNQATYDVPGTKPVGVYTYVRQSKSSECPDWQSSNEFTVTVFACSFTAGTTTGATATFTDPRDGKRYKTVRMPDGKIWFAQNLNYTKDLTFNKYANEANGKRYMSVANGVQAIGSYWCPAAPASIYSGDENTCNLVGALYTWETAMMVDGKYADDSRTSSAWDESWVAPYYYTSGAPSTTPNADKNNARGETTIKDGGRGICPKGWHVPTVLDWAQMLDKVDGDGTNDQFTLNYEWSTNNDAGAKLKTAATYTTIPDPWNGSWPQASINGLDSYGFCWLYDPPVDHRFGIHYNVIVAVCLYTSSVTSAGSTCVTCID
jgi:uncharacterized protein (TIGR02145 family)